MCTTPRGGGERFCRSRSRRSYSARILSLYCAENTRRVARSETSGSAGSLTTTECGPVTTLVITIARYSSGPPTHSFRLLDLPHNMLTQRVAMLGSLGIVALSTSHPGNTALRGCLLVHLRQWSESARNRNTSKTCMLIRARIQTCEATPSHALSPRGNEGAEPVTGLMSIGFRASRDPNPSLILGGGSARVIAACLTRLPARTEPGEARNCASAGRCIYPNWAKW